MYLFNSLDTAIIDLRDTPSDYGATKYLKSTISGTEWVNIKDLFYDKPEVIVISGSLNTHADEIHDNLQSQIDNLQAYSSPYGLSFTNFEEVGPLSTTSVSFLNALDTGNLNVPAGTYRVGWYLEWSISNSSYPFVCRLLMDNETSIMETNIRTPDASSWNVMSGFKYVIVSSGTHYVDVDFKSTKSGKTASIRNIRLEFWRVS